MRRSGARSSPIRQGQYQQVGKLAGEGVAKVSVEQIDVLHQRCRSNRAHLGILVEERALLIYLNSTFP
jgi:hypothetical protein